MIAVVDYGRGNLFSLSHALRHLDCAHEVTDDPARLLDAERIILPGVGAFGDAMRELAARGLVEPLRLAARRGTPLLGICLGMELLFDASEEFGRHQGLGLVPGEVRRLPEGDGAPGTTRIPNVGWRALRARNPDPLFAESIDGNMVYFVHSYTPIPDHRASVIAAIDVNGSEAAAVIRSGNVVGYQFHPEKSGPAGLALIERFLTMPAEAEQAARASG